MTGTQRDEIARMATAARRYVRALVVGEAEERAEIADQIVQEALLRVLRGEGSGRHSSLRISLYVAVTMLARTRQRGRVPAREDAQARPSSASSGRGGITQALDRLPAEEREALLLVAVEEFDYAEACEILNIARPSLVARLGRARRALSEQLEPGAHEKGRRSQAAHLRLVK